MTGFTRALALFLLCLIMLPAILVVECPFWVCRITLLEESFHAALLRDSGVYPAASAALTDSVVRWLEGSPELRPFLTDEAVSLIRSGVSEAISPAWMEGEVNRLVSGAIGYVKGEAPPPRLSVDLRAPKARMAGALSRLGLPASLMQLVAASMERIPDDFVPTSLDTERAVSGLAGARPVARLVTIGGPVGAFIAVIVVFLAWAAGLRGPAAARWIGAGVVEGGLLTIGIASLARAYSVKASAALEAPVLLESMRVRDLAGAAIDRVFDAWQAFGVGMAAAGLLLFCMSFLFAVRRRDRAGRPRATPS